MVIPWVGYSLNELIQQVEPFGNALRRVRHRGRFQRHAGPGRADTALAIHRGVASG